MSRNESFDAGVSHLGSSQHLAPRTFGLGGKYTTRPIGLFGKPETGTNPKYAKGVEAVHTNSGRRIGYVDWFDPSTNRNGEYTGTPHPQGSPDATRSAIYKAQVSKNMQRKGFGKAMLDHARDLRPGLQHSGPQALSPEGAAWAAKHG